MPARPSTTEHDPFYSTYIDKVPDGPIVELLQSELDQALAVLRAIPPELETYAYAEGKWSVREALGHVIDTERVFGFRALNFAREASAQLPGMDQEVWSAVSNAGDRPLAELIDEFEAVRRGHVAMFGGFDDAVWERRGFASGFEGSVRALAYIITGHEIHHREVLQARYL